MATVSNSSQNEIIIPLTKERKSSIRTGSIIFSVISLFPLLLFLPLSRFQIPFPVRGFNDGAIFLLIATCFILFVVGLWTSWYMLRFAETTLRLSPTSVQYHTPHFVLHTSWENIERIGLSSTGVEAFLLRQEAVLDPAPKLARNNPSQDSIPLAGFGKTYGQDTLAIAIRQWAPHLIQPGI